MSDSTTAAPIPDGGPRRALGRPATPSVELSAGRTPTATPAAAPWAILFALVVLALGVVGIRDALVAAGVLGGRLWTTSTAEAVDGLTRQVWMVPAGAALALLGLWLLLTALKPRKRTETTVAGTPGAWMRPGDVARLARAAADDVDGVVSVSATATRRKVTLTARTTTRDTGPLRAAISQAVSDTLDALQPSPRVKVRTRYTGGLQ